MAHSWPIFFSRGVLLTSTTDAFFPGHFTFDVPEAAYFLHKQTNAGGKDLVTLRTFPENPAHKPFHEYTFDLDKDCAVTDFRFWLEGEVVTQIEIEWKQWGKRWAPTKWTAINFPNRKLQTVAKARVDSFETDVPVTEENGYDILPPEGAKVGRSDFQPTDKPGVSKIEFYGYEVKNGQLVRIIGPVADYWVLSRDWRLGMATGEFVRAATVVLRRWTLRRKA